MRSCLFWATAALCVECNKTPPTPAKAIDAHDAAPAASASARKSARDVLAARRREADAGFSPDADFATKRKAYWTAMIRGRKATIAKRYPDAYAAFDAALVAIPHDARALSEKGYAELLAGDLVGAGEDFDAARSLGEDSKLAAQTWFNIGLLREKQGRAPEAHSAFAASQKLVPSAAAAAKLGAAEVCSAEITESASSLEVAHNWVEADGLFGGTETDETKARTHLCRFNLSADASEATTNVCDDDPPYNVAKDYMWFNYHGAIIFPGPGKLLFFFDAGMEGGWPAKCQATHGAMGSIGTDLLWIDTTTSGQQSVLVSDADDAIAKGANPDSIVDEWNAGKCADGAGSETWTFYDKTTGAGLLTVTLALPVGTDETDPPVKVKVDKRVVTITGAGCNERRAL